MNLSRLLPCIVLASWCGLVSAQAPIKAERSEKFRTVFYAMCSYGDVQISITSPTVFLLDGEPAISFRLVEFQLKRGGAQVEETAGFLDIDGKAVPYSFSCKDKLVYIERTNRHGSMYTFSGAGDFEIEVHIGHDVIAVPVNAVQLNLKTGDSAADVVRKFGLPASKKEIYVRWPDVETHDGIIYNPEPGRSTIVEHWRFRQIPDVVFSIDGARLWKINSDSLEDTSDYREAWLKPKKPKAEVLKWTLRNGKSFQGRLVGVERGEVYMELSDRVIRIPLQDFAVTEIAKLRDSITEPK